MALNVAAAMIATLWAGLVIGISFVAQPVKFGTAGLSRSVALAVGRRIFQAMHVIETVLAFCLAALLSTRMFDQQENVEASWPALLAGAALFVQITLLMPPLSKRTDAVLAGMPATHSFYHTAFALTEIIKVVMLVMFAFFILR
jgi:hypothetical protein